MFVFIYLWCAYSVHLQLLGCYMQDTSCSSSERSKFSSPLKEVQLHNNKCTEFILATEAVSTGTDATATHTLWQHTNSKYSAMCNVFALTYNSWYKQLFMYVSLQSSLRCGVH